MQLRTFTGRRVIVHKLKPQDICIEDIAHSLSRLCRFGGHSPEFYSVAQHSVIVSEHCEDYPLAGLMHDASEAYLGDIVRPVRRCLPDMFDLERRAVSVICKVFNLPFELMFEGEIRVADDRVLNTEFRQFFGEDMYELPKPFGFEIEPVGPDAAKAMFLARFYELTS